MHLSVQAVGWDEKNGISIWGMFGWNAFSTALVSGAHLPRVLLTATLDLVTFGACGWTILRRRPGPEATFALIVFGALLISPHLYEHDVLLAALPVFLLSTLDGEPQCRWLLYAATGWVVLYFHFDILSATHVNPTAVCLAAGLALALRPSSESALRHAMPWATSRETVPA